MKLSLVTPPTDEVVTVADLKVMLGIASDAQDDLLEALRDVVVQTIDPAGGGWLGRALAPQTWELRLDNFPCERIRLPFPPVITVDSVKYLDAAGVEQTLAAGVGYRVLGVGGTGRAEVAPLYQGNWPVTLGDDEAVRIVFTAGYSSDDMPKAVRAAVALGVRHLMSVGTKDLHLSRDEVPGVLVHQYVVSEAAAKTLESTIAALLGTLRVYD